MQGQKYRQPLVQGRGSISILDHSLLKQGIQKAKRGNLFCLSLILGQKLLKE